MTHQVKVNSITTFGTCCINNPIGICRDASEEYFEIVERAKQGLSRLAHGPNLGEGTWPEKSKGVTDISENWFLVFFGLYRLDASCS